MRRWTPLISFVVVVALFLAFVFWPKDPREAQRSGRHREALDAILARAKSERPAVNESSATTTQAIDALANADSTEVGAARGFTIVGGDSVTCFDVIATRESKRTELVVKIFEPEGKPPVLETAGLTPPCRCDRKGYFRCN